jgi:hypothetical protein
MPETGVDRAQQPAGTTEPQPLAAAQAVSEHVGEAHQLLTRLRQKVQDHPELDAAIERLEHALAVLNVRTGGML